MIKAKDLSLKSGKVFFYCFFTRFKIIRFKGFEG